MVKLRETSVVWEFRADFDQKKSENMIFEMGVEEEMIAYDVFG